MRRLPACLRRLLAREDGIALPVALSALAIISLLAAMTASGAMQLSDSSTADRSSKRALTAAEGGLNVAAYRVIRYANQTPPLLGFDGQCVTTGPTSPLANGECPAADDSLGNGARYTYYVTPKLAPGTCPTQVPGPTPPAGSGERCVTSTGTVNGVVRRVQARLSTSTNRLFGFEGLVGTGGIKINNGVTVASQVATNGTVTLGGTGKVGDIYLASGGSVNPSPQSTYGTIYTNQPPFILPKLDAEFLDSLNVPPNVNAALPGPKTLAPDPTLPSHSGNVFWTAANRDLELGPGATITLAPGTYNFCRLKMAKNAQLYVAPGGPVKIFIDSPDRDSTCGAVAAPRLLPASGTQINNPGEAKNLQIYIYGRNDGSEEIVFNNGVSMRAAIYAPQSYLKFASDLDVEGAVAARFLEFSASVNFKWDPSLAGIVIAGKSYQRSAWSECRRAPTVAADPESGC